MDFSYEMFFNEKIKPHLESINIKRKSSNRAKNTILIVFFSLFALFGISFALGVFGFEFIFSFLPFVFISVFIFLFVFSIHFGIKIKKYSSEYKEIITRNIVGYIDPKLQYEYLLDGRELMGKVKMFGNPHYVTCDDAIHGIVENQNFSIYDIYAYNRTSDSDGDSHKKTIFKGVLLSIDLKTTNSTYIEVMPKVFMHGLTKWLTEKLTNYDFVDIQDEKFSEIFGVKASDSNMVKTLIHADLRSLLLKLYEEKYNPKLSISNGVLYLGLDLRENRFDVDLNKEITKEAVFEIINDINHYIDIIRHLKQMNDLYV